LALSGLARPPGDLPGRRRRERGRGIDPAAPHPHPAGPQRGRARRLPRRRAREGKGGQGGPRRAREPAGGDGAAGPRRARLAPRPRGRRAAIRRRERVAMAPADQPFSLIIFGASGDLTRRKLVPALWSLYAGRTLPEPFTIIGSARSEVGPDEFRLRMRDAVREFARTQPPSANVWDRFAASLSYVPGDPADPALY